MMIKCALALLFVASIAFGQETGKPMFFDTPEACLSARDGEFAVYAPHFTDNLGKWQALVHKGEAVEITNHGKAYCVEEWSVDENLVKGWRIVRWPENNSYFRGDGMNADGRCGNTVRQMWEVPTPPVSAPPPPQEEVQLPPSELRPLPPEPEPWQPEKYDLVIIWPDRPGWSKIPGLNCIYEFGPGITRHGAWDIVEKGGCVAAIVLPLTLPAGAAAHVKTFPLGGK